ncbi:hypothetical protein CBF90_05545 [Microbacterium sp. AISO3]|nr:hypothetical protein CBF90_05545 [Microbacterium sp. AISO3]
MSPPIQVAMVAEKKTNAARIPTAVRSGPRAGAAAGASRVTLVSLGRGALGLRRDGMPRPAAV